ncbi:MAG: DUF1614 domain-containing protein [Thermoplasmata archaeon]|uniref:DUF1614 domain-containing protein n=1 Tax=Candidatus Aciduliprofundum boonei TaxID=379547 RepID=A0A7J3TAA6_9ARCH|nr:DUF1614 domain-containing protein [Thermoplasmata archaeon]HHE75871.1 DUF1614 domain-containing protein [Candidatus Aciduliprofundum boonei]
MSSYGENKILIFQPMSPIYFIFLLFISIFLLPYLILTGIIFGHALEVPPYIVLLIFLLSLFGSYANIRIKEVESIQPIIYLREAYFFGVRWRIPEIRYGPGKMVIAINVGGALVPLFFSLYLLIFSVPTHEINPLISYVKILVAFIVVTLVVHSFAKPIRGIGIAIPSFIPPLISAIVAAILFPIYTRTNPFIIAYVAGTLGTLVGADLLNWKKIPELGAPMASIGGAGVFDGVYMTGLAAVLILWLFI